MTRILALIDHSIYAQSVAAHAVWLSNQTGAEIDLVHIVDRRRAAARHLAPMAGLAVGLGPGLAGEVDRIAEEGRAPALKRGAELLEQTQAQMLALGANRIRPRLLEGRMLDIVRAAEDEVDAIVLGKRGEQANFARLPLGSFARQLARKGVKPILMAARSFRPIENWLLAFQTGEDFSASVTRLASSGILPPIPCSIVHAQQGEDTVRPELVATEQVLNAADFPTSVQVEQGHAQQFVPQHVARESIDLIALGGLRRSSFWSAVTGGGTAELLIRACQVPALLLR